MNEERLLGYSKNYGHERKMCESHKPVKIESYLASIDWGMKKSRTETQKQCPKCKYWLFKEEM